MLAQTESNPTNWVMLARENLFLAVADVMPVYHSPIRLTEDFSFVNNKRRKLHPVLKKQIKQTEEFLAW